MPDKTKTVVVIESHKQTIIRRSQRVISSQLPTHGDVDLRSCALRLLGATFVFSVSLR